MRIRSKIPHDFQAFRFSPSEFIVSAAAFV